MNDIKPITLLRNTEKLKQELEENGGRIFITKNGQKDFVVLSDEEYQKLSKNDIKSKNDVVFKQSDPLGFVKVSSQSIQVEVAGVSHNVEEIKKAIKEANDDNVKILVLPELCLTGYTCGDLILHDELLDKAENAINDLKMFSKNYSLFFVVGAPLRKDGKLFNCAVAICKGAILGVVPKTFIPNYAEFYEMRYYSSAPEENSTIHICGESVPFGVKQIFVDEDYRKLKIAIEICEDAWAVETPSSKAALAGANVILNLSASNEIVGKASYRLNLVKMNSSRLKAAYVYADAGDGESTTDLVFGGHNIIAENGKILCETPLFSMKKAVSEIDLDVLLNERRRNTSFEHKYCEEFKFIRFSMPLERPSSLTRVYKTNPFIPSTKNTDLTRVQSILDIQSMGLVKRLKTTRQNKVILGLSGGLDSTLALLVCVEAFKKLSYDPKNILCITMPAFGTSKRTYENALLLSKETGVSLREINIGASVLQHFKDIGHDPNVTNIAYENSQARERTQVLMDLANDENALMIGTGDLSEICLGWCTYNGDHMSNYGVNGSIPKTLVRYLVEGYAIMHPETRKSLLGIIETPISPELLPPDHKGEIAQKTESVVGPYEVHDFYIYHYLRHGFTPRKLHFIANEAYKGKYSSEELKKYLGILFNRFFKSQFKRSCMPDGAKVGTVAVSPRGDWRMPSDASSEEYMKEIESL